MVVFVLIYDLERYVCVWSLVSTYVFYDNSMYGTITFYSI